MRRIEEKWPLGDAGVGGGCKHADCVRRGSRVREASGRGYLGGLCECSGLAQINTKRCKGGGDGLGREWVGGVR